MSLNKSEINDILGREEIVYIATTKQNGSPHIVPIWFVYHQGKIYFNTESISQKFKNIQNLNKISLCFGGKETYIVEGSVKWYSENDCPVPLRQLLYEKYPNEMKNGYITPKSLFFEVIPEKEMS